MVNNKNRVVQGGQWGDEGKGKVVDLLCVDADIVARFQGGNNAGHTIVFDGNKYVLHLVPSGIFNPKTICVIGNGPVLDPFAFVEELKNLTEWKVDYKGRIFISGAANLILPYHKIIDGLREKNRGVASIGTTKRGIGPAYGDKTFRSPVISIADLVDSRDNYSRLKNLLEVNRLTKAHLLDDLPEEDQIDWEELFKKLVALADIFRPMMADISLLITEACKAGKKIVFEGAQGAMLDVDLGTRPFVTSSHVITGGVCTGLGIGPQLIGTVTGIIKAYTTRVGAGPFPTELFDEIGDYLYEKGEEVGASTGRDRRCGWLDLVLLKHTCRINGVDDFALTKLDVLDGLAEIKVCIAYELDGETITEMPVDMSRLVDCKPIYKTISGWEGTTKGVTIYDDLPVGAMDYISFIIDTLDIKPSIISTGPDRKETIIL